MPHAIADARNDETRYAAAMLRQRRHPKAPKMRGAAVLAAFAVGTLLALTGCSSETLPPALTKEQLKAINSAHFKATIGVMRYNAPVYSDYLMEYLRKTKLFDEVVPLEALQKPPTFVARVDRGIYGTATIPIFTMITFGIIPTIVEEEHGLEFSLIPNSPPKAPIAIRFSYKGPSTLGWWALFRGFLPNETWGSADWTARFVQSFAWHIIEHEKEISAHIR